MVYAGAQKNIGPAGVTVVLLQDEFAKTAQFEHLPFMLRYDTYIQNKLPLQHTPRLEYFLWCRWSWSG